VKTANVADVKFAPGVTDFPATPQPAPDNRVERALKQGPQVIPYLSQGLTSDDVVGARPDDRADRFAHSDVSPRPQMATASGSTTDRQGLMAAIGGPFSSLARSGALGYSPTAARRPQRSPGAVRGLFEPAASYVLDPRASSRARTARAAPRPS
jgi:hypothetical protein